MAGILKVDQVQSDSNLAFNIAGSNVAFMNATSLQMVGSNVSLAGTNVITNGKVVASGMPTGAVLQVVQTNTTTTVTVSTNTYTDTGLSASITPTSATSKILVLIQQSYYSSTSSGGQGGGLKLLRGATDIYNPMPTDATGPYGFYVSATGLYLMANLQYLDSPATTSNITYKTQGRPYSSGAGQSATFQVGGGIQNAGSSMILMEIAG
jgi:hypothetical protein